MFIILLCCDVFFFFFKQKTAYELRISDWSSDVCSSDLAESRGRAGRSAMRSGGSSKSKRSTRKAGYCGGITAGMPGKGVGRAGTGGSAAFSSAAVIGGTMSAPTDALTNRDGLAGGSPRTRSEERRGGKEGVSTGRTRGVPYH